MTRTLLAVGGWQECGQLIASAITNGWRVVHTLLLEDIVTALEKTNVDLVLLSGCESIAGWEQTVRRIWVTGNHTPVLAIASVCSEDLLVRALIGTFRSAIHATPEYPGHDGRSWRPLNAPPRNLIRKALTPTITLLERNPNSIAAGVLRALDFIEGHYHEPLTLADAASAAFYSKCHFCKLFKEQIGMSFVSYLSHVRIDNAINLLTLSDKAITVIAYEVGFNDLSHFERVFRTIQNESPSQFRRRTKDSQSGYQYPPSRVATAMA